MNEMHINRIKEKNQKLLVAVTSYCNSEIAILENKIIYLKDRKTRTFEETHLFIMEEKIKRCKSKINLWEKRKQECLKF